MSSFIFCLIFIQVSIFFVVTGLLLVSLFLGLRTRKAASRATSRNRFRIRRPMTDYAFETPGAVEGATAS